MDKNETFFLFHFRKCHPSRLIAAQKSIRWIPVSRQDFIYDLFIARRCDTRLETVLESRLLQTVLNYSFYAIVSRIYTYHYISFSFLPVSNGMRVGGKMPRGTELVYRHIMIMRTVRRRFPTGEHFILDRSIYKRPIYKKIFGPSVSHLIAIEIKLNFVCFLPVPFYPREVYIIFHSL